MEYNEADYKNFITAHEIASRVVKVGVQKAELTSDEKTLCEKIYKQLGNKSWRSCVNCWQDLHILTNIINQNKIKIMSTQKFTLKKGKQIQMHGLSKVYTHANMTDAVALDILSRNRGHLHLPSFERYPDNWADLVEKYKANGNAVTEEPAVPVVTGGEGKKDEEGDGEGEEGKAKAPELTGVEKEKADMRATLDVKSKGELKEVAKTYEYPEAEYKNLGKGKMVDYLIAKQFPE